MWHIRSSVAERDVLPSRLTNPGVFVPGRGPAVYQETLELVNCRETLELVNSWKPLHGYSTRSALQVMHPKWGNLSMTSGWGTNCTEGVPSLGGYVS